MALTTVRDLLNQHFNEAELRQLCFDLTIEYENLSGETRLGKAQSLMEYGLRNDRLPDLIARCQELRPDATWPDVQPFVDEWQKVQAGIAAQENLRDILPPEQIGFSSDLWGKFIRRCLLVKWFCHHNFAAKEAPSPLLSLYSVFKVRNIG